MPENIMILNVLQESQWFVKFVTVVLSCSFYNLMKKIIIFGAFDAALSTTELSYIADTL